MTPAEIKEKLAAYRSKKQTPASAAAERKHHQCSPSSLQAREACPCYDSEQKETPHVRTVEGTKQHDVAERKEDDNTLSDERMHHVAMCDAATAQILEKLKAEYGLVQELKEVYMPAIEAWDITAGYIDLALIAVNQAGGALIDYKFGDWEVEPVENNLQVWAYVCALFDRFVNLPHVDAYIMQPANDSVDHHRFYRKQVPEMLLRIKRVRVRYDDPRKNPKASVPACLFCKHLAGCSEAERIVRAVSAKYPPLKAYTDVMHFSPTTIASNTPADNAVVLDTAAVVEAWAKAVRTQVTEHAVQTGSVPPTFTLQMQERRSVVNADIVSQCAEKWGVPADVIAGAKTISIEPLTDNIRDRAARGTKDAMEGEFKGELTKLGAYGEAYPVVMLKKQRTKGASKKETNTVD